MEARVVRYADLVPCYNAFIDTRSPGSEAKENFTIIGPGVSENPDQHVHIAEPHGFNIGGARQPPGCVNSQHSHDTAEVFVIHSGTWSFNIGEHGEDARVICNPGDVISLPTGMFRGFTNIGDDSGYLFAVLGGDDPGRVLWAPYVFEMAKDYGLVLLENGELVDTAAGQAIPANMNPMPRTTAEQIAKLRCPTQEEAERLVWRPGTNTARSQIIGPDGWFQWDHGFNLQRFEMAAADALPTNVLAHANVIFVQNGTIEVHWDGGSILLAEGDTMTVPAGLEHSLSSPSGGVVFSVSR
ncbi:MAG: cupin domain-containing protein [Sphingomonadaceae bacterium]|nr:cupin domain-containing protein [Sphingomonadaceae bacterium]